MRKISNFWPFFILIIFITIIGFSTYKIKAKQQNLANNLDQNSLDFFVSENIELQNLNLPNLYNQNDSFSIKDLKGKYSIINVFASWCTTCRAEHEYLLQLQQEKIVDIYGVAWRDINENTKNYLEKSGNPFIKVASDNKALLTEIASLRAVPETFVVNPEGKIILRHQGNLEHASLAELRRILKELN
ncbi:MAG: redoxin domain-containing protein [Pelagibacterales bacterium]|nr:redoxin domain-containing protein [Pelagibacterales bacterium]